MLISRILLPGKSRMAVIYLVPALLPESSGLPKGYFRQRQKSKRTTLPSANGRSLLLDLAPDGVCHVPPMAGSLFGTTNITIDAVSSYLAFSPLWRLWHHGIFSVALSVS
jgi:hypothetical protein